MKSKSLRVKESKPQTHVESTTHIGNTLDSPFILVTNDIAIFLKHVAKKMDDEVDYITPPNEAHKAPIVNPFLVELEEKFNDELINLTMIEEDDDFKSFNLSTKPGKVKKNVHILPRYDLYIFLPTIANLHSYSVYCYYHPHLIPSGGNNTLLQGK